MCAVIDNDRVRFCDRLQPSRKIGGFPYNGGFIHLRGLNEFTNDHDSGGDTYAYPEPLICWS
jgi:hypothetical protein